MKTIWNTAVCCLSLLIATGAQADQTTHNGQPIDPCAEYQDGPCICYCPMIKYKPKYHCEKKCYTEAYQVPRICTRYVPEYYTKTFCRQVPEQYTVCDTKYRTKYYTVTHCSYVPCRYTVKKCCANPCGDQGCGDQCVAQPVGSCCPVDGSAGE